MSRLPRDHAERDTTQSQFKALCELGFDAYRRNACAAVMIASPHEVTTAPDPLYTRRGRRISPTYNPRYHYYDAHSCVVLGQSLSHGAT